MRWQGHSSADDSWEPVEHLAHCPERVAEYEAAPPRRPKASGPAGGPALTPYLATAPAAAPAAQPAPPGSPPPA